MKGIIISFILIVSINFNAKAENINYFVIGSTAAPFQIDKKISKKEGIVTDIVKKVLPKDIKITSTSLPFKRYVKRLKREKAPWITYGSPVWTGPQSWNLSKESLFEIRHVFMTKKGKTIRHMEDLFNKRIVLITGFDYPALDKYIKSGYVKVIRVNNHESAIAAVEKERGIAFPEMELRLRYHMRINNKDHEKFEYNQIDGILEPYPIHIAFSRNFSSFLKRDIDMKIKKLKDSGEISKIVQDYVKFDYRLF